jgi:MoaA/NifB/PqqE/SkfB family radical SAM enzyme
MPLSDFEKILDEVIVFANPEDITVVITGGEPLMRDDILDIGEAIVKRGFRWVLETNGFLLNLDMQKQLANRGLSEIILSLDGMEKNHNWFRGHPNSFENSLYAIKQVVRFHSEIDLKIITTVHKKNLDDLDLLKDMLIQLKVKKWLLQVINPNVHNTYTPISELLISKEDYYTIHEKIKIWNSSQKISVKYSCNGNNMNGYSPERDTYFHCPTKGSSITLNADGHVTGCPKVKDIVGNIYNTDFRDIWEKGVQANNIKSVIKGCNRLRK